MRQETAYTWSWLNMLNSKRYEALKRVYGTMEEAIHHLDPTLLRSLGCKQDTIEKALVRLEEFDHEWYAGELNRRGIHLLSIEDTEYPSVLREIGDPPMFLYYRGDISILEQPCVGIVGTRKMSFYGKRVAEHFTQALVRSGVVTVSGLAYGIDCCVAHATLETGGRTVAVLGCGLGMISPKGNNQLSDRIVESGGLIVSEFSLDKRPEKYTFPARNRIIAGLSLGTLVCEAPQKSGARITAELALDYGRDVFAVPGPIFEPNYEGCHALIATGQAKLVAKPEDLLQEIGVVSKKTCTRTLYQPQNSIEKVLYEILTTMPQPLDNLVEKTTLATSDLNAALTMMELNGAVKNLGVEGWVRC